MKLLKTFNPLKKPTALGWGEWERWHAEMRAARPLAYFAFETVPSELRNALRGLRDAKYWVRHRTVDRYDRIYIRDLQPGYYDKDTQLLYGMFSLLRDYVENECAHLTRIFADCGHRYEDDHPRRCAACQDEKARVAQLTDAEAGLERLDTEIALDEEHRSQAQAAEEIKALYLWWTVERPHRPDPYDVHPRPDVPLFERNEKSADWAHEVQEMEDRYGEEDTEMMIRLVKIRGALWT